VDSGPPPIESEAFARAFTHALVPQSTTNATTKAIMPAYEHWLITPIMKAVFSTFLVFVKGRFDQLQRAWFEYQVNAQHV
jgi:hypothetical protein